MKRSLLIAAAIGVLVVAWFLLSPLVIDRTVDEAFEIQMPGGQLDVAKIMQMPAERRDAMRAEIMAVAADAPDQTVADAMPDAGPRLLRRGTFIDADSVHRGAGTASLYALGDGRHLLRFEDFRATNGPDLVVYLAKHPAPRDADDVTSGGFLSLGKLKGNVGNQNYPVPDGVDVAEYGSIVIWCELFGVLFSPASLEAL